MSHIKWAAFKWFIRDSAPNGDGRFSLFYTVNNCFTSITNQPTNQPIDNIINHHWFMAWCWRSAKPLTVPMLTYCQQDPYNQTSMKFDGKYKHFYSKQILENVVGKMGAILFRQ